MDIDTDAVRVGVTEVVPLTCCDCESEDRIVSELDLVSEVEPVNDSEAVREALADTVALICCVMDTVLDAVAETNVVNETVHVGVPAEPVLDKLRDSVIDLVIVAEMSSDMDWEKVPLWLAEALRLSEMTIETDWVDDLDSDSVAERACVSEKLSERVIDAVNERLSVTTSEMELDAVSSSDNESVSLKVRLNVTVGDSDSDIVSVAVISSEREKDLESVTVVVMLSEMLALRVCVVDNEYDSLAVSSLVRESDCVAVREKRLGVTVSEKLSLLVTVADSSSVRESDSDNVIDDETVSELVWAIVMDWVSESDWLKVTEEEIDPVDERIEVSDEEWEYVSVEVTERDLDKLRSSVKVSVRLDETDADRRTVSEGDADSDVDDVSSSERL
jgi:hypothetical protein